MLRKLLVPTVAVLVGVSALAVEVVGPDDIDERPPEVKPEPEAPAEPAPVVGKGPAEAELVAERKKKEAALAAEWKQLHAAWKKSLKTPSAALGLLEAKVRTFRGTAYADKLEALLVKTRAIREESIAKRLARARRRTERSYIPRRRSSTGIALRASYLIPAAEEISGYSGALAFGGSYTFGPEESRLSYELGVDVAGSGEEGGSSSSTLVFLRAAALYRPLRTDGPLYLLGGGNLGIESVDGSQSSTNSAGAMDLGVGGRFGSLDTRLAYSIYLGSDNAGGALALSVGYAF